MSTPSPAATDELTFAEENQGWVSSVVTGLTREQLWEQFVIKVRM